MAYQSILFPLLSHLFQPVFPQTPDAAEEVQYIDASSIAGMYLLFPSFLPEFGKTPYHL